MNFGDTTQIKGCMIKARFLESSSGNSSIDNLLGGALPSSCITILDETRSRVYADTLTKYFLSEGLYNDHDLLVVDPCSSVADFFKGLPTKIEVQEAAKEPPVERDNMKIAWRYESAPKVNSAIGVKNRYDLGKTLEDFSSFRSQQLSFSEKDGHSYLGLLKYLKQLLNNASYVKSKSANQKNLLRIVIRNLGSPLWSDSWHLSMFLAHLQYLTRNSYCLVMVTTCSSSLSKDLVPELEVTADCFFRLVAMTDDEKKVLPSLDKAHGYFYIIKLPRLTSIATHCPSAVDLIFELHRRSFDIKILHLPPALSGSEPSNAKTACSSIDF